MQNTNLSQIVTTNINMQNTLNNSPSINDFSSAAGRECPIRAATSLQGQCIYKRCFGPAIKVLIPRWCSSMVLKEIKSPDLIAKIVDLRRACSGDTMAMEAAFVIQLPIAGCRQPGGCMDGSVQREKF